MKKETDLKLGSFIYTIKDGEVYKLRIERKTVVESILGDDSIDLLLKEVNCGEFVLEVPLEDLLSENSTYFLTISEVIDHLMNSYKSRYEEVESSPTAFCNFLETDGYTNKHIGYVKIPLKYIEYSGDSSVTLTEDGVEWFKKSINSGFDNGGYYRLIRMSDDDINKIVSEARRILDIFTK